MQISSRKGITEGEGGRKEEIGGRGVFYLDKNLTDHVGSRNKADP